MSTLTIHNTLTRRKEPFVPLVPGKAGLYVCGPTVYDFIHVGNARTFSVFDLVVRWLRASGYAVTYVRNITDVDDKIMERARERGIPIDELTASTARAFAEDCARLGLPAPDSASLEHDLAELAPLPCDGALRLTVTRGEGPRGYKLPPSGRATRILACWPTAPSGLAVEEGLNVRLCDLRLGHQPALAGIKHLNRLENVLARAEWQDPEIHEGLLLDQDGRVVSGVMSNVFIWSQDRLMTPRLHRCGVAGVTRSRLVRLARTENLAVEEVDLELEEVMQAQELMFCNSLWGLRRAVRLGARSWNHPAISPRLIALLDA